MWEQLLHRPSAVDSGPTPLSRDVVEPHHYQAIALVSISVKNDRKLREAGGIESAEIDSALLIPTLQMLERRYTPIAFDYEESPGIRTLDQDWIDVEPTVCLDARDQVSNVFLLAAQHDAGRAPLHVRIEDALRRNEPVIRMVHEPKVVWVEVETAKRQGLPSATRHLFRGFVVHGSLLVRRPMDGFPNLRRTSRHGEADRSKQPVMPNGGSLRDRLSDFRHYWCGTKVDGPELRHGVVGRGCARHSGWPLIIPSRDCCRNPAREWT